MYNKIPNNCIKLVHNCLGTELIQYNYFNNHVLQYLEYKETSLYPDNLICGLCYIMGINYNDNVVCYRCNLNNYSKRILISFNEFKITEEYKRVNIWRILSKCGYNTFKKAIYKKNKFMIHYKEDLCYEICNGVNPYDYKINKYNKLKNLMNKYNIN